MTAVVRLGVTGTRDGFTDAQRARFVEWIQRRPIDEFHQGDCVGVDVQAFEAVVEFGDCALHHVWPGDVDARWRAGTDRYAGELPMVVHDRRPPLERNRTMTDALTVLWGFPSTMVEQRRSGTWSTIRYAKTCPVKLVVVLPDGSLGR